MRRSKIEVRYNIVPHFSQLFLDYTWANIVVGIAIRMTTTMEGAAMAPIAHVAISDVVEATVCFQSDSVVWRHLNPASFTRQLKLNRSVRGERQIAYTFLDSGKRFANTNI